MPVRPPREVREPGARENLGGILRINPPTPSRVPSARHPRVRSLEKRLDPRELPHPVLRGEPRVPVRDALGERAVRARQSLRVPLLRPRKPRARPPVVGGDQVQDEVAVRGVLGEAPLGVGYRGEFVPVAAEPPGPEPAPPRLRERGTARRDARRELPHLPRLARVMPFSREGERLDERSLEAERPRNAPDRLPEGEPAPEEREGRGRVDAGRTGAGSPGGFSS